MAPTHENLLISSSLAPCDVIRHIFSSNLLMSYIVLNSPDKEDVKYALEGKQSITSARKTQHELWISRVPYLRDI